jgi:hypothetical protein
LTFGAEEPAMPCVIWNISEGGARLAVARSTDLPRHFTLSLHKDGSAQHACEVVWTDSRFVGVKFAQKASGRFHS